MQATAKEFIIALDEGTTNAKAVVLDSRGKVIVKFSQPLAIQTPRDGWVEQSGEALVTASLTVIASAVAHVGAENVAALAISNQRETAIGWYRDSGEPINAAITWQCTRSAAFCDTLRHDRQEHHIKRATGLPIARCSRPPKCAGCWMRLSMATCAPNAVRFASAPSTAGCCGI